MNGRLAENVMHFGRLLRRAGLPLGPGQVLDGIRAAATVDIARRSDLYWALAAVFVKRREELEIFEEAFTTFWRDPRGPDQALTLLFDRLQRDFAKPPPTKRRVRDAWSAPVPASKLTRVQNRETERVDAVAAFAPDEVLRRKDFEQMSAEELCRAKSVIAKMRLGTKEIVTRRRRAHHRGAIDLRRALRKSLTAGGDLMPLAFSTPRFRPPAIVVLCDISGSMELYSRVFLFFMHTLASQRDRVHAFVFGTRLTNVTRIIRSRDVDAALERVGNEVPDWSGGTRIRSALHEFNQEWSRRVLGQGAIVLFVTDGLDRDVESGLAFEIERLRRSCRTLVWLNPLLRYEGFQPLASGVRILIDRVDQHRPVHNLHSLEDLVRALD